MSSRVNTCQFYNIPPLGKVGDLIFAMYKYVVKSTISYILMLIADS